MTEPRVEPRRRTVHVLAWIVFVLSACSGTDGSQPTAADPDPTPRQQPTSGEVVEVDSVTPTPVTVSVVDRIPAAAYLPRWVPDGYDLESVTWFDSPEEIRRPAWVDADAITLGDSAVLSERSIQIRAYRFASDDDLARARWIEDALLVQGGGPSAGISIEGTVFLYDSFGAPGENVVGGEFHTTIGDVLVSGLIFGPVSQAELEALLASLLIGDEEEVSIEIDPSAAGLIELDRATPKPDAESPYELAYSDGTNRFSVHVTPGSPESSIALGSVSRDGDRLTAEHGSGFLESQPEVGNALGSRRLIWWVPTSRMTVWFGSLLTDQQAIDFADSFELVDAAVWQQVMEGVAADTIDFGPMNLPEDPEQAYQDRLAEQNRAVDEIRERPEFDVTEMIDFIQEFRGSTDSAFSETPTVQWQGPIEADAMTSGINFFPEAVEETFLALQIMRASDGAGVFAEARRQDIRGACCGINSITLMEGMGDDEAAVVAAHEFTHLYDTMVLDARFVPSNELFDASAALREGNANRAMIAYRDAFGLRYDPDRREYLQLLMRASVRRAIGFAYTEGQAFTEAIAAAGGEAAIDRAFVTDPPLSTEHILHPGHYLAGDKPVVVAAPSPAPDVIVERQDTLGAFVVALVAIDELGWDGAVALAGTWAGDSFIAWTAGNASCLAANIEFDDETSAQTFADLAPGDTHVTNGVLVELETCSL